MSDTATNHGPMKRAEYEDLAGINWSVLKHCIDHPAKALEEIANPSPPTDRMILGSAIHARVLEGQDAFRKRFAVAPLNIDRRTNKGKEEWSRFQKSSSGKQVIPAKDKLTVTRVADSAMKHPAVSDLIGCGDGVAETVIRWELDEQLFGKGIIDWLPNNDGPIVDLKTTRDASPSGFARQIANFRYHGQACFYRRAVAALRGEPKRDFVIIALEVEPPYCVGVYRLNDDAIEAGERMVEMALDRWIAATRGHAGYEPHYTDYIEDLGIPTWAMNNETANLVA